MLFANLLKYKVLFAHKMKPDVTNMLAGPKVMKLFSCSTQLSMKFQLLFKTKIMLKHKDFSCFILSDHAFIMLINDKMSTIVVILTFMSMKNFMII